MAGMTAVPGVARDIREVMADIGRHWGWVAAFGVLSIALGVVVLVWPNATVVVVASLLGAYLLVSGIFQVVNAFSATLLQTGYRWLIGISGVLSILLGLYAFRSISHSVTILVLLIGYSWLLRGFSLLFDSIAAPKGMPGRGWAAFTGILDIVAGLVVLMYPGPSLSALTLLAGIWLIILGLTEIVGAFRIRSLGQTAAGTT
jgi:uncharacterized membrane protein HdeD (DUF308 family)